MKIIAAFSVFLRWWIHLASGVPNWELIAGHDAWHNVVIANRVNCPNQT